MTTKAERVHAIVNAGHFPGMSESFDAHMGAACWTDPAYAPDASMWAAAWKAATAAERERLCAAIKDADDYCVTEGDYMLDSNDCISVIRGTWTRPDYNPWPNVGAKLETTAAPK